MVTICIQHLRSEHAESRCEAAKVLGFVCYDEDAKSEALDNNVVEILLDLLVEDFEESPPKPRQPTSVLSAATMALMAVTSTDEGKRLRDSGDALLQKHASVAIAAVNWNP